MKPSAGILAVVVTLVALQATRSEPAFRSHPPMRPLPITIKRAPSAGPTFHADATRGDDANDGSREKPWKTIAHALTKLKPGDTLSLRGGVYYEHLTLKLKGEAGKPITIRSHPGELAILDGGLREFLDTPEKAWEPVGEGAKGEFRSTKAYPKLGERVFGHFADSWIPLHGYRWLIDLRSDNEFWNLDDKLNEKQSIYCGPGVWYDVESGRIHARLAHTTLAVLGDDNYRGETDPRKLPLVIAGGKTPLAIEDSAHLKLQDLVVRGSSVATVRVTSSRDLELDGVSIHGGSPALYCQGVEGLRLIRSVLRGISAPWSFRTSHKYRGTAAYLLTARGGDPLNRNWEIGHCELTDCHDGPYIGSVKGLKLHHCLVENFNDDGVYLTAEEQGGDLDIYQNHMARCLHVFSFHGNYKVGAGVRIYRNLIDLRGPVPYYQPNAADDERFVPKGGKASITTRGRMCGDHGSPTWEPVWFYHNTVLSAEPAFRDFYAAGWGGHLKEGTSRRVFNNIFVQTTGNPGLQFNPPEMSDLHADGNLLWGLSDGPAVKGDFFAAFRKSPVFEQSKKRYPPGWTANDLFADPKLMKLESDWKAAVDVRLRSGSPAIDAGLELPGGWPDPLRNPDRGKPDLGAIPADIDPLVVGPASKPIP